MFRPPSVVGLIALFTQAALYGLYVATLIHCLRWLVFADDGWKLRDRFDKPVLITTIFVFLFSTMNLLFSLPLESYLLENSGESNILSVGVVGIVCKCHGSHFGQRND